jgi:hypothetical protein
MREMPGDLSDPADDLTRYRYHTGAPLRPLRPDEPCPVLFRDLGVAATACFLRGELRRLAGPLTPITYMRTEAYVEPYTDYEQIGRIIFLRPLLLQPWHSGVPAVYVARATRTADPATIAFVPGHLDLAEVAQLTADMRNTQELREALGGREYDEVVADTLHRLDGLENELKEAERQAEPLRRRLQSPVPGQRQSAQEEMARLGIAENDLCAAWHHLPRDRRTLILDVLQGSM